MKFKCLKSQIVLCLSLGFCLSNLQPVSAAETTTTNPQFIIFDSTQAALDKLIEEYPQYDKYVSKVISNLKESVSSDSPEDINRILMDLVEEANTINQQQAVAYNNCLLQYKQLDANITSLSPKIDPALELYKKGISIIKNRGCDNTARYMKHAIVDGPNDKPAPLEDNNTAWSEEAVFSSADLQGQITEQFEEQILANPNASGGAVSGFFDYSSNNSTLDLAAALHSVRYQVTFTKRPAEGYSAEYLIQDYYDFEGSKEYDNFEMDFANNYCYLVQELGIIHPFQIFIYYSK